VVALALGVAVAAVLWAVGVRRPGWTAGPLGGVRRAGSLSLKGAVLLAAVPIGLCVDARVRAAAGSLVGPPLGVALGAVGDWLRSPGLSDALLFVLPICAVTVADATSPGALDPAALRRRARAASGGRERWVVLLPLVALLLGWGDVLLGLIGAPGAGLLAALGGGGGPETGPDPRVPALAWWLGAGIVAVRQARLQGKDGGRWWLLLPVLGGVLAVVARPVALATAEAAFLVTAAGVVAASWWLARREGLGLGAVAPQLEALALVAILCLALTLRWEPWPPGTERPMVSDAGGYFAAAQGFHARVISERTNPIALAYLNIHPAAREPLFILMLRGLFDLVGESPLHQRYLTMLTSVGCVGMTYRFGRRTLGAAAGLVAAFLLALEPWHIDFSREGLREEWALLFVYGLALLTLVPFDASRRKAVLGGALAAAATLTRLDAAAVVSFLLLVWSIRAWPAWRRAALSWATFGALIVPMLIGFRLRTGEALAPLGTSMGGDIRASMTPLFAGELPAQEVARLFAAGTVAVYRDTMFAGIAAQAGPVAGVALAAGLAAYAAGLVLLTWRGPRLPVALSLLGTYVPPFAYIAGIALIGGPGAGYTDRYAYLTIPATLAICAWAGWRFAAAAGSRVRALLAGRSAGPARAGRGAVLLAGGRSGRRRQAGT
jgi:hypothetical protein